MFRLARFKLVHPCRGDTFDFQEEVWSYSVVTSVGIDGVQW
jgi:hypothetical protein